MDTNQAVAQILRRENVEWISCFPSNDLIEACAEEGIRTVMFRHERGAVMAADGYSRLSNRRRFGVAVTQGGPGAENSMGGIAQAFSDNIPILYFAEGPRLWMHSVRPNFSPARTYQSVAKYTEIIYRPDMVGDVMRRAFHALRNGRPGPVVIEIPSDVGRTEMPHGELTYHSPARMPQVPSHDAVRSAVKALLSARRPVIWSGMGVLLADATDELRQLAETTGIPVYCTLPGKSSFDERHPLALGSGSAATTQQARTWLQDADVVFAVGSSLTRNTYAQPIPDGKLIIHNVESIEDINKDYGAVIGLPGDAKLTLQAIIRELSEAGGCHQSSSSIPEEIAKLKRDWLAEWQPLLDSDEVPINTYRIVAELERTLDHDTSIVTHDAGAPRDMLLPFYTATVPHSYIGWGKTTHLGYGIPLMIGAKMAMPERFCVNFMGDGAFGMSGMDIETSVRAGAPITTIVINNGAMATYPDGYPAARDRFGATLMSGDYAKIAEGLGATGIRITEPAEIAPALERARRLNAEGKTVLLDIHTGFEGRKSTFG